jgi:hypothetical protein
MVSDNSTSDEHVAQIEACCRSLRDRRLQYVRCPQPLAMARHWEWALRQAMQCYDADHFTFVSSRWIVRAGALPRVMERIAAHPDAILTYDDDAVIDDPGQPIRVVRKQLTGRLLCIDASQLLYLVSRAIFPSCLPRMLNCVLPRRVIDDVTARFGDVFGNVAPDHCCAYRCLAVVEQFYHYDEAVLVQYGQCHSTGTGLFKQKLNEAAADFKANADPAGLTWAAPIPEIETNINVVFHEYCLAKRHACSSKFPEVDRGRYFQAIVDELTLLEDDTRRTRFAGILRKHGWQGSFPSAAPLAASSPSLARTIAPFWTRVQSLLGRRPPEDDARLTFRKLNDALWFTDRYPKRHVADTPHAGFLQPGWRLPA